MTQVFGLDWRVSDCGFTDRMRLGGGGNKCVVSLWFAFPFGFPLDQLQEGPSGLSSFLFFTKGVFCLAIRVFIWPGSNF